MIQSQSKDPNNTKRAQPHNFDRTNDSDHALTIANPTVTIHTIDPWQRYYAPLMAEFIASLLYTLFCALQFALFCCFGGISGGHFNPAITLTALLTQNVRLVAGISMIFVQIFGSFFGALLTRTTLSSVGFMDAFITLGVRKPNYEHERTQALIKNTFENEENSLFANRFQIFLLETLLSTLFVSTYSITSTQNSMLSTASSVGATRVIVTLIGLHSLGQSGNLARQLANNTISSVFLMDDRVWRFFYISFFSAFSSGVISAGYLKASLASLMENKKLRSS